MINGVENAPENGNEILRNRILMLCVGGYHLKELRQHYASILRKIEKGRSGNPYVTFGEVYTIINHLVGTVEPQDKTVFPTLKELIVNAEGIIPNVDLTSLKALVDGQPLQTPEAVENLINTLNTVVRDWQESVLPQIETDNLKEISQDQLALMGNNDNQISTAATAYYRAIQAEIQRREQRS